MSDATIAAGTEQRLTAQELKAQEKAAKKTEKERLKRVARDEKAERKRAAKSGFANVANPRRSTLLTIVCALFAVYCLFPFVYLLINARRRRRTSRPRSVWASAARSLCGTTSRPCSPTRTASSDAGS